MNHQADNQTRGKTEIGVLYGFRALMVLFVCNYHIWQLGWLGQYATLFGQTLDFDFWTRSSYLFVDGMLLLSGFLLYLPYARQTVQNTPVPGVRRFYWNRLERIVPSYLFSVLAVLLLVALPSGAYRDASTRNLDVLTHLTFTFTFFRETYLYTPLNGVLWTVAIEMQFYLIFPWLAKATQKKPVLTLCTLVAAGIAFRLIVSRSVTDLAIWVNQLPAFLDVYALGMLAAIIYVRLSARLTALPKTSDLRRLTVWISPLGFALACWALTTLVRLQSANGLAGQDALRLSQWALRLPLAITMAAAMLAAAFLPRFLQKLLDNRLMRFLATISFNLYIWHQVIGARLAANLFPATLHSDLQLQRIYTLLCFAVSILAAMAVTYGIEKPAARLMEKIRIRFLQNKERKNDERPSGTETV